MRLPHGVAGHLHVPSLMDLADRTQREWRSSFFRNPLYQSIRAEGEDLPQLPGGLSTLAAHIPQLPGSLSTLAAHIPQLPGGLSTFAADLPQLSGSLATLAADLPQLPGGLAM